MDVAEFERLMRRYNQRLYRACRSVLRDDAEAEDATQEAWVRAWQRLDQLQDPRRIGAWLTRIALNEAMGRARKRSPVALSDDDMEEEAVDHDPQRSPERAASDHQLLRLVEQAIDELPERFRTVFVLRLVEGLSVAETAECLEIPAVTVKTRLHRARKRVADRLMADTETATREAFSFDGERCDRIVAAVLGRIS